MVFPNRKKLDENPFKWAITGLIGYWLVWWIMTLAVANPLLETFEKSSVVILLLIRQLPAIVAIAAAVLIRKKFLVDKAVPENSDLSDQ
ncbi:MAG: hypothetical protein ACU84J_02270 [Gammaproteobacteria bacterium]